MYIINPPSDRKANSDDHQDISDLMDSSDYGQYRTMRNEPATFPPIPMHETKPRPYYVDETDMKTETSSISYFKGRFFSGSFK